MSTGFVVLRGGLLSIVVDRGRFGYRGAGVPCGGALDAVGYAVANVLAGNQAGAAAIEVTLGDFAVRFDGSVRFALAGADCAADLDGKRVDAWGSYEAAAGAVLTMRRPRSGARSYVAVAGGIEVPSVLGSRDTNLAASFGGYRGRALREGDRLPIGVAASRSFARDARPRCKPPYWDFARDAVDAPLAVRFIPGAEYERLDEAEHTRFLSSAFVAGAQSNRMGLRLTGVKVALDRVEMASRAVFPGVVQLPPSGEPIVLLRDAHVTGGYPQLGCAIEADLWKLAQVPAGATLRFKACSLEEAARARAEIDAYVRRLEEALR